MKKLSFHPVLFFTVSFSLTVIAQNFSLLNRRSNPRTPNKIQKILIDPLPSGKYTIGAGGDFPTIDSVFNKLSIDGISGPVSFELIDDIYTAPPTDTGFLLNGPIAGADQNNRVLIQPATNKKVTIEGYGAKVLYFLNTSYLTMDGISLTGNTTLTIHSTYNSHISQFDQNDPVNFYGNSNHNEFKNITVMNDDYTRGAWSIGLSADNSSPSAPDSNVIKNNAVKGGSVGIVLLGSSTEPTGNDVTGNHIGSETDSLITVGMDIEYCKNTLIEKNIIQNLRQNWTDNRETHGITEISCSGTIIRNNIIHNIYDNVGPLGALGIVMVGIGSVYGSSNLVYNNMIYDIYSSGKTYMTGILLENETNPKVYFNSVCLFESSNTHGAEDLLIQDGCTGIDVRNNILVIKGEELYKTVNTIIDPTTSNLISDNNDLYCKPDLVRISNEFFSDLTKWQSESQDPNSISQMPNFIDPDLHIDKSIPTNLESHGTPIAGIDADIDGDPRNTSTPDIGADEFDGTNITAVKDEFNQPLTFTLLQNYPNPFNPSTVISFAIPRSSFVNLKIYDVLGRAVTTLVNEEKTAGKYEVEFNATNLSSGIYFYEIQAGSFVETKKMILLK